LWSFSLFEEEDLINFLQRGLLEDELGELLRQWDYLSPAVQLELIKHLRSTVCEEEMLARALGIKKATAKALLENPAVEFEFPAVSDGGGRIVKALAVPNTSENYSNIREQKRHIKPVTDYLRSRGVLSEGLSVFFDSGFVGNSFQLAMVLSFLVKKLPSDLCWTGGVRKDGRLAKVDSLEKKAQLCQMEGKRLAMPFHLRSVDELTDWLNAELVDIPLAVSKDPIKLEEFFEKRENLLNLWHIHRIDPSELILHTGRLEGELWKETARRFSQLVKRLDYTLERRLRAHLVINGPVSLAFALGVLYGHTRPSAVYHYLRGDKRYYAVELFNTREVKEAVGEYRHIRQDLEGDGEELAVVLYFGHHNPVADIKAFLADRGIGAEVLLLWMEEGRGNIDPADFKPIAKECASAVQEVKGKKHHRRLHFFFSCPVVIAYLFGVAFGHFGSGVIYNFEGNTYEPVLELEFLRGLIED
jgi:hypothetical protein